MKKILFLSAVCLCFFIFMNDRNAAAAETEETGEKHAIDIELEKKLDSASSTSEMIEASAQAEKAWDKLLNQNYNALMKKLNKKQQEQLRASQKEWIKYRDLEFNFNASFWNSFDGTMYRVFPAGFRANFVRERVLQLGNYLEGLNDM